MGYKIMNDMQLMIIEHLTLSRAINIYVIKIIRSLVDVAEQDHIDIFLFDKSERMFTYSKEHLYQI